MENKQIEFFQKLKEVTQINNRVYQPLIDVTVMNMPCITFFKLTESPLYSISGEAEDQNRIMQVDIWAENTAQGESVLIEVESKLKEIKYILKNCRYVSEENLYHLSAEFSY